MEAREIADFIINQLGGLKTIHIGIPKKVINRQFIYDHTIEDLAKRLELKFQSKLKERDEKIADLSLSNASLRMHLNIEIGVKAALCECTADKQEIPCKAGDYCMHEQNKPLNDAGKKIFRALGITSKTKT